MFETNIQISLKMSKIHEYEIYGFRNFLWHFESRHGISLLLLAPGISAHNYWSACNPEVKFYSAPKNKGMDLMFCLESRPRRHLPAKQNKFTQCLKLVRH